MEYVSKKEVKPWINKFNNLVTKIRPVLKEEGIKFTVNLVGSSKRNLVIRHHNKGFDCDFQIYIMKNKKCLSPKEIKLKFIEVINNNKESIFDKCEDKTKSIKLKYKDVNNKKIIFSYDIVILRNFNDEIKIIKKIDERKNIYDFVSVKDYSKHNEYFKKICGNKMWKDLREMYYNKKINNTNSKKSFQLLHECVIEILKKYNIQL